MLIRALAPAKINLGLDIKGKREDGYHEVDMLMQTVDLFDVVNVKRTNDSRIAIKCNKDLGCAEKDNIAYKVAEEFFSYTGIKNSGIFIEIEKNIPLFAGLAGGSSDGAAVILCLDKLFNAKLSIGQMQAIGGKIGADIPFCISGGTARARGKGTILEKIKDIPKCGIAIVKPECSVSTKEAYEMYDEYGCESKKSIDKLIDLVNNGNLSEVSGYLFNGFENFITNSEINNVKKDMLKYEPLGVCMSGSGPSVFAIFSSFSEAGICAEELKLKYANSYVCRPVSHGVKIF